MDGKEWKYGKEIQVSLVFSPDSKRLAYVIKGDFVVGANFVVVDDQEQKRYGRIEEGSLVFSPDSQQVAYVARAAALNLGFIKVGQRSMVVKLTALFLR